MSMLELMAAPFAECMVLVAIHTYLGIHVLRRRVIFVDLALAQTAALGTTVGFLFGIMPDTTAALVFSMTFTFLAAAVFALTRIRGERVPQEAIIGLIYAITAAVAVLVVQKTHGAEHLEGILVGSLLWVNWNDVIVAAVAYAIIGAVHFVFRKRFLLISEDPDKAYRQGLSVRAWDFLFYVTFGFVITFSTRVAGVLLVFVFLVAPAIMAFMITDRIKWQLLIGWIMGTVVTVSGLYLSYAIDLPSGPTVVAFYGVVLVLGALVLHVVRAQRKLMALGWIGIGVAVTAAVVFVVFHEGKWLGASSLAHSEHLEQVEHDMQLSEEAAERAQTENSARERAAATAELRGVVGGAVPEARLAEYLTLEDADSRLEYLRRAVERDRREGLALLVCFLSDEESPLFFRTEAVDLLKAEAGDDFGYDPEREPGENRAALEKMRAELLERGHQRRHRHRGRHRGR
jgi:zinc/manganese transport system permease protein